MSLARCDICGVFIDTDACPNAYYQVMPVGEDVQLDDARCYDCIHQVYKRELNKIMEK